MAATSRPSSATASSRTLLGRSPRNATAAPICLAAGSRKSPKVAVIVTTGHQVADSPGSVGGLGAGSLIAGFRRPGCGAGEPVIQQLAESCQSSGDLIHGDVSGRHA